MSKKRINDLNKAKKIYDKLMREGIYQPEQIEIGYKLVFPDRELPNGVQQRREFIGFYQYLYSEAIKQLEELFSDSTPNGAPKENKDEQTHSENETKTVLVDLNEKEDKPTPKKKGRKPKKKE